MPSNVRLKLMNISKRVNAVAPDYTGLQPAGTEFNVNDFYFREPTDIEHPIITVSRFTGNTTVPGANCRMDEFNYAMITFMDYKEIHYRYYFIIGCKSLSNGKWEISLQEDYLRQWWNYLKETEQLVHRSASNLIATMNDPLTIMHGNATISRGLLTKTGSTTGCYIVGMTGSSDGSPSVVLFKRGSVKYYAFTQGSIETLVDRLQHLSGTVADQNPMDRIISIMWLPIEVSSTVNSNITINFNDTAGTQDDLTLSLACYSITNALGVWTSAEKDVTLPSHPQYDANHAYLNLPPYTVYTLRCGAYGDITIDQSMLQDTRKLYYSEQIDLATGQGLLVFSRQTNPTLYGQIKSDVAMLGCNIPLTQITSYGRLEVESIKNQYTRSEVNRQLGMVSNAMGVIGGVTRLNAGTALQSAVGIFGNALEKDMLQNEYGLSMYGAGIPHVETKGASGSLLAGLEYWFYIAVFQPVKLPPEDKVGYPYETKATLKNLSGYCQCGTADIGRNASDIAPNLSEIAELQKIMLSGFYINA